MPEYRGFYEGGLGVNVGGDTCNHIFVVKYPYYMVTGQKRWHVMG